METREAGETGPEQEPRLFPPDEKRRMRLKRGRTNLLVALVALILMALFQVWGAAPWIPMIFAVIVLVYAVAGVVCLIAGLLTKGG